MHFKASCSYAALAAIMELNGVATEDYKIALEIKLPWLFFKEDGAYISGPMLQGAKWFNLWLVPRGYRMVEEMVDRKRLCNYLRAHRPVMLGIQTPYGKHAVVFAGYDGIYHFMNPTHESSGERTELLLSEEGLLASVDGGGAGAGLCQQLYYDKDAHLYRIEEVKNSRPRTIALNKFTHDILVKRQNFRTSHDPDDFVFTTSAGTHLCPTTIPMRQIRFSAEKPRLLATLLASPIALL